MYQFVIPNLRNFKIGTYFYFQNINFNLNPN